MYTSRQMVFIKHQDYLGLYHKCMCTYRSFSSKLLDPRFDCSNTIGRVGRIMQKAYGLIVNNRLFQRQSLDRPILVSCNKYFVEKTGKKVC